MGRTLTQWSFTGLAICAGALNGFAGEAVVRQFGDWTVTISPKKSALPSTVRPSVQAIPPSPSVNRSQRSPSKNTDVVIRPISFEQPADGEQQVAAPVPEAAVTETAVPVTAQESKTVPQFAETPLPMPPAPAPQTIESKPCVGCELPVITPKVREPELSPTVVIPQTALYRDIYFSIPFNRVEYEANPSYRHDATMELLFNQMRPTVIQRGTQNVYHYDMNYLGNGYAGSPYYPYYPFNYGLRIHHSR